MEVEKRRRILELRAGGVSFSRIATEVGVSKQTAIDVCRKEEDTLAALHALEWDELLETHRITKIERITAHANLLRRIREEIEGRSLEDIPTEKLIDLYLKQSAALEEEIIEPTFKSSEEQERDKRERKFLEKFSSEE